MLSAPRVSVITITFNQQEFVAATLDSLLEQDLESVEFIVSDDCSTDRTPEILTAYQQAHPERIRLTLRSENVGAATNFIETVQSARGDYVAFCDGDDYWTDPQKLRKQVAHMDAHPESAVCFHPVVMFDGSAVGGPDDFLYPSDVADGVFTCERLLVDNFIATNSVMYRRQDYAALRTDIMPADWYLHLFHAARGTIAFLPEVMAAYRRHPGGLWTGAEKDPYLVYSRYGVERVALQDALWDLFSHDTDKQAAVAISLGQAFRDLLAGDAAFGEGRAVQAAQRYPRSVTHCLAASLARGDDEARKAEELWAALNIRNDEVARLAARVTELRRKLEKTRAAVRALRSDPRASPRAGAGRKGAVTRLTRTLPARLSRLTRR